MARYETVTTLIDAHLINAANVADTGSWPAWIIDIIDAGNGNWLVQTADNGTYEIEEGKYISITGAGDPPVQLEPTVIENDYLPYVE